MPISTQAHRLPAQGEQLAATLYLPPVGASAPPPVVVMAHGFGGKACFRLPAYAERFAADGMAVLLFDYRGFGQSTGTPRELVDAQRHLEDWRAAIRYARALKDVDGTRLGLWGTSFSGGHVLAIASEDAAVTAVVAQVPFVGGLASLSLFPLKYQLPAALYGLADLLRSLLGLAPLRIPIVSPGHLAALTGADCLEGYHWLCSDPGEWTGQVPARIFLTLPMYAPARRAERIQAPVLFMPAAHDSLIPLAAAQRVARRIPKVELDVLPLGHFQPYMPPHFDAVVQRQSAFLAGHLRVG